MANNTKTNKVECNIELKLWLLLLLVFMDSSGYVFFPSQNSSFVEVVEHSYRDCEIVCLELYFHCF